MSAEKTILFVLLQIKLFFFFGETSLILCGLTNEMRNKTKLWWFGDTVTSETCSELIMVKIQQESWIYWSISEKDQWISDG